MDAFTGEIRLFPYNFAPQNWAYCDGTTLLVQQNPALYSVIGTLYGGTPGQNFKLPNLNGRVAMGTGGAIGSIPGTQQGADRIQMVPTNISSHSHTVLAKDGSETAAAVDTPSNSTYLAQPRNVRLYNNTTPSATDPKLAPGTVMPSGNATIPPIMRNTMQPFLTLVYCICLDGEYPMRS
ncbi:tail fiber protein [Aeromonas hydrophila]|uniref:phage tail protein n=1 Tax=Aeromonas hydrophila TaxID=644 RepID=UPI001A19427F|nr:tail fiber protein [Aeromonas hydrophila]MCP3242901.1 tail fiber protein [Aeromonas hydrophila]HAU4899527.1 phage tail protein [Aeromonas hydrophila]